MTTMEGAGSTRASASRAAGIDAAATVTVGSDSAASDKLPQLIARSVNAVGIPVALLDMRTRRCHWASDSWCEAFGIEQASVQDDSAGLEYAGVDVAIPEAVSSVLENLQQAAEQNSTLWLAACERAMQLRISQHDDQTATLSLHEMASSNNDMLQYMQDRESMFTTSRTISVSEMATTLAHEIKQPIATITNILKALRIRSQRQRLETGQLQLALDNALEQAEFTNSVINRIRDFTQARRPRQQLLDVNELLENSLSLLDWLLQSNGTRVDLKLAGKPLHCMGDSTMLQQVIMNLLRNGVEAMLETPPERRRLKVDCEQFVDRLRISIRDQGHGLEGKEESLFIPFTTSKASGMGVGLNICRSFVELHQGRLWLSPNSQGGCTSHIELPLVVENQDSTTASHANHSQG